MPRIAVIDDNPDQSSTVKNNLEIELEAIGSTLEVITALPFKDPNNYFDFILRNDVCVLILDQMLNDQAIDEEGAVGYKGSQIINDLREKLKDLPIFALTVIPSDEDLRQNFSQYEDIISRKEFYEHAEVFVPKIWRAAKNYLQENLNQLSRFNELTKQISGGNEDPELIKQMQALQIKLELPFSGFEDRNAWLKVYEDQIKALEDINTIIKKKIGDK